LYLFSVHYVTHQTNLTILVLNKLALVMHIKNMLQSLYSFFRIVPRRFWNLWTLPRHWKTKGLKLLRNIKTCWISMLSPLKCVLGEYKSLIVKMHMDMPKKKVVIKSLDMLCSLELVFGLPCIFPMLEMVYMLIKHAQRWDVFMIFLTLE
jgi:hypothetical protein